MTLTLHRNRWIVRWGNCDVVDTYEWSFAPIEPTRSVHEGDGPVPRCVTVREPDGELVVETPPLARLVELDVVDKCTGAARKVVCLAFHGEDGIGAESVARLAERGERGFRMAKKAEQPSLFDDDQSPREPVGAYGRRKPREDRVTPVAAELKSHAATSDVPPWMPPAANLDPLPKSIADPQTEDQLDAAIADVRRRAAALGTLPTEGDKATGEKPLPDVRPRLPNRVPQNDVAEAGRDLIGDVDRAIHHIQQGSGATAIAILRRVRASMGKEG
jgi:hypothetical protein